MFAGIAVFFIPVSFSAAADLSSADTSPYMEPDVVPTWDGFYVGAEAGGAVDAEGKQATELAGLYAGYNWQSDRLVLGVRADGDWRPTSADSSIDWVGVPSGTHYTTTVNATTNFISTLTGRIGYTVGDRLLPFLSAGLAFSELGMKTTLLGVSGQFAGSYGQNSHDDMSVGWTVGGGLEYRLTQHWSIEGQYQYYSLGSHTLVTYGYLNGAQVSNYTYRFSRGGNLASLGVNYHF